jgi:hypothetical protein
MQPPPASGPQWSPRRSTTGGSAGARRCSWCQGLDDRVAVPENGRRLIAEIGDRGRLVELADAGHALLFEQPDVVANVVLAFLRDQEATSAERAPW